MVKNRPFSNPASDSSHTDLRYELCLLFIIQSAVLIMVIVQRPRWAIAVLIGRLLCPVCYAPPYLRFPCPFLDTHKQIVSLYSIAHTRHHYSHHTRGHTSLHNCTSHAVDAMTKAWAICASQHCLQSHNELVRTDAIYSIIGRVCVQRDYASDRMTGFVSYGPIQTGTYRITRQNLPWQDPSHNI